MMDFLCFLSPVRTAQVLNWRQERGHVQCIRWRMFPIWGIQRDTSSRDEPQQQQQHFGDESAERKVNPLRQMTFQGCGENFPVRDHRSSLTSGPPQWWLMLNQIQLDRLCCERQVYCFNSDRTQPHESAEFPYRCLYLLVRSSRYRIYSTSMKRLTPPHPSLC